MCCTHLLRQPLFAFKLLGFDVVASVTKMSNGVPLPQAVAGDRFQFVWAAPAQIRVGVEGPAALLLLGEVQKALALRKRSLHVLLRDAVIGSSTMGISLPPHASPSHPWSAM